MILLIQNNLQKYKINSQKKLPKLKLPKLMSCNKETVFVDWKLITKSK